MKLIIQIGNSKYKVFIEKYGGKVFVCNRKTIYKGQWIPDYNMLILKNMPFKAVSDAIEKAIAKADISKDVVWPYISQK